MLQRTCRAKSVSVTGFKVGKLEVTAPPFHLAHFALIVIVLSSGTAVPRIGAYRFSGQQKWPGTECCVFCLMEMS